MPIGVIINSLAVFCGGLFGALFSEKIPKGLSQTLPLIFGLASMAMGITAIPKLQNLPAVVLALVIGSIIGELSQLEQGIERMVQTVRGSMTKLMTRWIKDPSDNEADFMDKFVGIVVLFCVSGTGVFGALQSGMTGDHTILFTKSILDFFTAAIFGAGLGVMVALIAIPQFLVLAALFFSASLIMPLTTPTLLADFTACGGILMVAAGFRICGLKSFPIGNMVPAMAVVMPISALWSNFL